MLYADFLVLPNVLFLCHNTTLHLVVLPGIHFFWEEDPRGKVPFSSHNIKEEDYHDLSLWMLTLITRLRYYLSGFSLSIPDSLEGSHYANPALAEWQSCNPLPWGQNIYINHLQLFCTDLTVLFHLVIYFYQSRVMSIYFIIWVTLHYYFMLVPKLFQLWPLETLSATSYAALTNLHGCGFCEHCLTFQHYQVLQVHLVYPCSSPGISHSARSPGSFC